MFTDPSFLAVEAVSEKVAARFHDGGEEEFADRVARKALVRLLAIARR